MTLKSHKYVFFFLVLVKASDGFEIKMEGILSIDINVMKEGGMRARESPEEREESEPVTKRKRISNMTAPPVLECIYQYPDQKQMETILSNMMNELTKIFLRAHKLARYDTRSRENNSKRYKVIRNKSESYFEEIFANMSNEYRHYYNHSLVRTLPSGNPCNHQEQLKEIWSKLLDFSTDSLRRASRQCIEEYLRVQNRSHDHNIKHKLEQFLRDEILRARGDQLVMLCDYFQICYGDLL